METGSLSRRVWLRQSLGCGQSHLEKLGKGPFWWYLGYLGDVEVEAASLAR